MAVTVITTGRDDRAGQAAGFTAHGIRDILAGQAGQEPGKPGGPAGREGQAGQCPRSANLIPVTPLFSYICPINIFPLGLVLL